MTLAKRWRGSLTVVSAISSPKYAQAHRPVPYQLNGKGHILSRFCHNKTRLWPYTVATFVGGCGACWLLGCAGFNFYSTKSSFDTFCVDLVQILLKFLSRNSLTDSRTHGLTDSRTHGLTDSRKDRRTEGRKDGRTEGRKDGRTEGRKDGRTEGRKDGRTEGRKDGRTEGRKDGRTEGRKDGRTEGRKDGRTESPMR